MRELWEGLLALRSRIALVPLLLVANLGLAAILAVPLARTLERDLRNTDAAARMTAGFDYDWWSEWAPRQNGPGRHLSPEILGLGFFASNLDRLFRGQLPVGLFRAMAAATPPAEDGPKSPPLDPLVLVLGLLSMLVQTFLAGGVLGVLRAPQGRFTMRGVLFGSAFYWGRLLRVALLALLATGMVFAAWGPLSALAEHLAKESVSERTALGWSFFRYAVLAAALGLVHMTSSYAKVVIVLEDRASAVLSFLAGASFAARHLGRALLQYGAVALAGAGLLAAWALFDSAFEPTGYRSQLAFLGAAQAFMAGRIALRLWLLASQMALYRGARVQA
jgi:hypothetical protein